MTNVLPPLEMIEKLVGFPTVSRDSNLALIDFVVDYLAGQGIAAHVLPSPCGSKANLYATVGPMVAGGVVLSGHTDVVPVDDQDWHTDPFVVERRDGRLYGRGTADMKSFSAIALALVPEMKKLQRPVHFALSYDEEVGCLGAPELISQMSPVLPAPAAVIVGEPTEMRVITAHKSIFHFHTRITGHEAHSSQQHRGVSAVMVAGQLINWLAERQRQHAASAPGDSPFQPPYTTVHCGVVHGGTAHNITAHHCEFVTDIRSVPGDDAHECFAAFKQFALTEVLPEMQLIHPDTGIEFEIHAHVPAFKADDDEPAVVLARQLSGQNACEAVAYGAEAGQFQQAGFSVVMCGPGSIDQAHQPNEYISLAQVERGISFLRQLIDHLSR